MIKSMTGFGYALLDNDSFQVVAEIKSLNSRYLDVGIRLPRRFADRELDARNLVAEKLERGKIALNVDLVSHAAGTPKQEYNEELFVAYYTRLKKLADRVYAPYDALFELALNSPDVIRTPVEERGNEDEWTHIKTVILEALVKCDRYREVEGAAIEEKIQEYVRNIQVHLREVERIDPDRIERIRSRLQENMVTFLQEPKYDPARLEQEMLYYIEKLDIHEERARLQAHLNYFVEVIGSEDSNGKKLSFISQEIGREINTLGAKANDAEIQRAIVVMKEELEKIKEQLGNVL